MPVGWLMTPSTLLASRDATYSVFRLIGPDRWLLKDWGHGHAMLLHPVAASANEKQQPDCYKEEPLISAYRQGGLWRLHPHSPLFPR